MTMFLSRGSTLLGGMLLLSLLSAAAIALDARGMKYVPGTQMASAVQSSPRLAVETTATPSSQNTTQSEGDDRAFNCEPGVNYTILAQKGGVKVQCTYADFTCNPAATTYPGCDGRITLASGATNTSVPVGTQAQCKKPGGTPSKVRLCVPEELQVEGKSPCTEMTCAAGATLSTKQALANPAFKETFTKAIDEAFRSGDGARIDAALEHVPALDDRTAKSLISAWGESYDDTVYVRKSQLDDANKQLDALQKSLETCSGEECREYTERLSEVQRNRDSLQEQVAGLDKLATRLEPSVQPAPQDPVKPNPNPGYAQAGYSSTFDRSRIEELCRRDIAQGNMNSSACREIGVRPALPGMSPMGGAQPAQQCSAIGSFFGTCQRNPEPSCTITATPPRTTSGAPAQSVTLSWQSQNAYSANLSAQGAVGPQGSLQVYPQQTTTYTLQVMGYAQVNGYSQQRFGQCSVTVQVGDAPQSAQSPTAQISCAPQLVESGMEVAIAYACQNATESVGTGFTTAGALAGSARGTVGTSSQVYSLRYTNQNVSHVAQCAVQLNKASLVLVANPKVVKKGESTALGWVSGGMESCVISSPALSVFTAENENKTSPSGMVRTPQLTGHTPFVLTCMTKAGTVRTASTTVEVTN